MRAKAVRMGSLSGAAAVGVMALSLVLAGPAAAVGPLLPVIGSTFSMPTVVGGTGATAIVTAEGVTTVGTVAAASAVVPSTLVVGALAVGYGIGWSGVQAVGFAKDKWFTDHSPIAAGPVTDAGCDASGLGRCWVTFDYSGPFNVELSIFGYASYDNPPVEPGPPGYLGYAPYRVNGSGCSGCSPGVKTVSTGGPSAQVSQVVRLIVWARPGGGYDNNVKIYDGPASPPTPASQYRLTTEGTCVGPGVAAHVVRVSSSGFTSSGTAPTSWPSVTCPAGEHLIGIKHITESVPAVGPASTLSVDSDWAAGTRAGNHSDPNAECLADAVEPCSLVFRDKDGKPLAPGRAVNPSTGTRTAPADCVWGGTVMVLADCGPEPETATDTTVTPTPTPTPTAPGPVLQPPQDPSDADAANRCWPSGWGVLNPLEWVYKPTVCALTFLFVPSPAVLQTAWGSASTGWASTGIPAWGGAVGGVGTSLGGMSAGTGGCSGPHFAFTLKGHDYAFDPLNACAAPMSGVAVVVKLFASIAVVVAGARLCARPVLASFGMRA